MAKRAAILLVFAAVLGLVIFLLNKKPDSDTDISDVPVLEEGAEKFAASEREIIPEPDKTEIFPAAFEREDFSYSYFVDTDRKPVLTVLPYPGSVSFQAIFRDTACESVKFDYFKTATSVILSPVASERCYDNAAWYVIEGTIRNLSAGRYTFSLTPKTVPEDPRDFERDFEIR